MASIITAAVEPGITLANIGAFEEVFNELWQNELMQTGETLGKATPRLLLIVG